MQRLYDVDGGAVSIDGQNVIDVTQESLRSNIALVPQEPILFHRSLASNIAYGRPKASMDEIIAAAKQATRIILLWRYRRAMTPWSVSVA